MKIKGMNKICTSIEQSLQLIELGIDVNTADMCYINEKPNIGFLSEEYKIFGDNVLTDYWPAWSLSALFNILPKGVSLLKNSYDETCAIINTDFENEDVKIEWFDNPLDAVFEMIVWLKENDKL